LIAVLLPVRNAEVTLDRALDSLWRQGETRFEVLAIDDGSTDDSRRILERHALRDPRLRILTNRERGLVGALELARNRTVAPYLARFDADDICHPQRLQHQAEFLGEHPQVAAVGSRVALFPRRNLGPGWRRYERWLNSLITPEEHAREIFVESPLAHPSVLMRADAVREIGGYRELGWAEDYDLWHRLHRAGWQLAKVDRPLLAWRHTPGRLSLRAPRYHPRAFLEARAHYLAAHPALRARRVALWGAGRTGRRLAERLGARGVVVTRFYDVDTKKLGKRIQGAPVCSWRDLVPAGDTPLVVAVGAPGARALIRPETERRGYREGVDILFAA